MIAPHRKHFLPAAAFFERRRCNTGLADRAIARGANRLPFERSLSGHPTEAVQVSWGSDTAVITPRKQQVPATRRVAV